jgi:DNA-binding transcriptional regulator of glucitol operon
VLRLVFSPRWLVWHVLTLGAMITCGFLSAWQWHRAGSAMGSALNVGYGIQWPIFAVFFGVMWWRFLRMEIRALPQRMAGPPAQAEPAASPPEDPSPFRRSPMKATPVTDEEDPEMAEYNRILAAIAEQDAAIERAQAGRLSR